MNTKDFDYYLPEELIAQHPIEKRDQSRLMVLDKKTGSIKNRVFFQITDYLNPGDTLVLNDTKVIPARLFGQKEYTGGAVEILLLKKVDCNRWEILVKPGKKAREGSVIVFGEKLKGKIIEVKSDGNRVIEFSYTGIFEQIIDELGIMPLPPYIKEELKDANRYQTVYSKVNGSAAAPTAGLHFTTELLDEIKEKGVNIAYLTLHVGLGTFRPVKVDKLEEHKMHQEYYSLSADTADLINETKANGKKVTAVGTTTVRTLETLATKGMPLKESSGWTDIFIYPGFNFNVVDQLITNFHLPQSTLIMLVSAFASREIVMNAYKRAVEEKYRFFSFGDAMFIK